MDISAITFKFFREFPYPDQMIGMMREPTYIPQWLILRKVPVEQHEEAIALIRATAKELLKTRGYQ